MRSSEGFIASSNTLSEKHIDFNTLIAAIFYVLNAIGNMKIKEAL